jgi:hypothetical protein
VIHDTYDSGLAGHRPVSDLYRRAQS